MRAGRLLAALAAVATLAPGLAHAGGNLQFRDPSDPLRVIDRRWDARRLPIRWVLSRDGLPGGSIDNATLAAELTAAFDTWESLPTSALEFEFGGEVEIRQSGSGPLGAGIDGRNLVTFTDPEVIFPLGVLAVTITTVFPQDTVITSVNADLDGDGTPDLPTGTYAAGTIFDGDIAFNSSHPWTVLGVPGTIDVRAVALHEIGHLVGLCHSVVRDAVMWPFLARDIDAARTLEADDIAYASFLYPAEPAFSSTFGAIRGRVTNGFSDAPILGAHVYAVDPATGATQVGAYSGDDGRYVIPGLAPGGHLVAIEPLDGEPPGLDPFRINEVVQSTFDTNFPQEFWDAEESSVEADPMAAQVITVSAGGEAGGIDLVTNTLVVPSVARILERGFNLFAYPVTVPSGLTAFDLLRALGNAADVTGVDRFVPRSGTFERAQYFRGSPAGVDFPIRRGEGYVVHLLREKVVSFAGRTDCPALDLAAGLNLIGVPCPPHGYTARALLQDLGSPVEVATVERYDPETGAYQQARYDPSGQPAGDDFPILNGEGYAVTMLVAKAGVRVPAGGHGFAPVITGLSPGRGVPGTIVAILGEGFDPEPTRNLVTFNGVGAGVSVATATVLTVTVPNGATSGPVQVTVAGRRSNTVDFVVESAAVSEGEVAELVSGQTVDGALASDGEQDRYTFTALAGSVVTISAEAITPGVPDLVLVLEDPLGAVAASDDNGGGGREPRINNFTLERTGIHTIVVTSVPGSGTGQYRLHLTIATRSAPSQLSILGGNYQTGLAGSALPEPLTVLATGPTGAPVAGVPVTFVATGTAIGGGSPSAIDAGTLTLSTNASGIVSVESTLSATPGVYQITVTAGGASALFRLCVTARAVRTVTMNGDQQSGAVDQALASPLEIVLRDAGGTFVDGACVEFQVASGGGRLTPAGPQTTGADGAARTVFTLGQHTDKPQLVAAVVPGRAQPLLFEATARADVPATIISNRSDFNRLTLGVRALRAIWIGVLDRFDNPVEGAQVDYTAPAGIEITPGLGPGFVPFPDFKTNRDGLHVAAVGTSITAISPGPPPVVRADVTPTIDERLQHRAPPYQITVTARGGGNPSLTYDLDLDMGPAVVSAAGLGQRGPIGEPLPQPVKKLLFRYQRVDTNGNGDILDEGFAPLNLVALGGVPVTFRTRRDDGRDESAVGLQPTRTTPGAATTDSAGLASVSVTLGDVSGASSVIGQVDGASWMIGTERIITVVPLVEGTPVVGLGVAIAATVTDSGSGIDLASVRASLNGQAFFDGARPPAVPPEFPDKLELFVGGQKLTRVPPSLVTGSAFTDLRVVYTPSRPKLVRGVNTVGLEQVRDRAGNTDDVLRTDQFDFP